MAWNGIDPRGTWRVARWRRSAAAGIVLLLAGCASAHERLDALLGPMRGAEAPGVAVMVIRNGLVVYSAGIGLADLERRVPIDTKTAFDIASVSKQFTAMLAMILHQEGRLDYDAPVVRFLPELARFGGRMTVRHLLTHTSGLPDYYEALAGAAAPGACVGTGAGLAFLARNGAAAFAPGERFEYSDVGYEMLSLILAKAAGEPFADLLRERIFEPLNMAHTRLRDSPEVQVPNRAQGYILRREGFVGASPHPLDCLAGSGAINTTLDDLYLWDRALDSESLVQRATIDEALRPMPLDDASLSPYAFGWFLKEDHGHRRLEHPGSWQGYQSFILRYPNDGFSVILLANRSDLDLADLAARIVRIYTSSDGTPY